MAGAEKHRWDHDPRGENEGKGRKKEGGRNECEK
jgi:hypothetical protein